MLVLLAHHKEDLRAEFSSFRVHSTFSVVSRVGQKYTYCVKELCEFGEIIPPAGVDHLKIKLYVRKAKNYVKCGKKKLMPIKLDIKRKINYGHQNLEVMEQLKLSHH